MFFRKGERGQSAGKIDCVVVFGVLMALEPGLALDWYSYKEVDLYALFTPHSFTEYEAARTVRPENWL